MPSLNFQSRFASRVSEGSKAHTIRAWRKRPFQTGDTLCFFTGMRTKRCRRLRANTLCTTVLPIEVYPQEKRVVLGGVSLSPRRIRNLARRDGFARTNEFWEFFLRTHGPALQGRLIQWRPSS